MPLSEKQLQAALLVARDRLTLKQIAKRLEISERTLDYWKAESEFKRQVDEHLNAWMLDIHAKGIADRRRRVFRLNDRWRRAQSIVTERAKDPATRKLPGGKSGFICRTVRQLRDWTLIEEGTFDAALFRELNAIEQQAARELGQLDVQDERKIRRLSDLSREEVEALMLDISKIYGIPMPPAAAGGDNPA